MLILIAYLLGSIPNALWIGLLFCKIDIREYGSGNVGSTNAARVLGYKYGLLTLVLDVLKSMIPVYFALSYNNDIFLIAVASAAIFGHSYSIFLKFKGGKSVATALGVMVIIFPKAIPILLIVFLLVFFITKYVSLASILAAFSLPIVVFFIYHNNIYNIFCIIIALLVIYRHKSNINNLLNGKEAKFSDKTR